MASSTIPFRGTAPSRARYGAADRARCLHPHEPGRSSHIGRMRCVGASLVAGSRRNRRTSGCAEGPLRSRNQDSRWLPDVSMEIDRCSGPGESPVGSAADLVWFGALAARDIGTRPAHRRTVTTHNAGHRRAQDCQCLFASVPKLRGSLIVKSGDFRAEFDEGGGLKNRCRFWRKSWIRQVLISRTLSVRGEVAERLKAAVC